MKGIINFLIGLQMFSNMRNSILRDDFKIVGIMVARYKKGGLEMKKWPETYAIS